MPLLGRGLSAQGQCNQNHLWEEAPETITLWKGLETSWDPTGSLDPMKIQWISECTLGSVQAWPRALPAGKVSSWSVPMNFGSPWPFTCPITPSLAMRGDALLSPMPLRWNNWSTSRKSREGDCLCASGPTPPSRDIGSHVQLRCSLRDCE